MFNPLYCTLETNIILSAHYIKLKFKKVESIVAEDRK